MSPSHLPRTKSALGDLADLPSLESVSTAATLSPEDLDGAIKPLRDYLLLQPNNYNALEKVRRARQHGKYSRIITILIIVLGYHPLAKSG
jgi:hypothetical protein